MNFWEFECLIFVKNFENVLSTDVFKRKMREVF